MIVVINLANLSFDLVGQFELGRQVPVLDIYCI